MADPASYYDQVSYVGRSPLTFLIMLAANWLFSAVHIYQEWRGAPAPLWRVFGAVVGVKIPNALGFAFFTVGLLIALWALGIAGITGWLLVPLPLPIAIGALGTILGALVADSIISHWCLYGLGYRPNPGLSSTMLYVAEAVALLAMFWKGLSLHLVPTSIGFALGAGFFLSVLPALRSLRVLPAWRRNRWIRWQPIPAWTKHQP